MEMKKQRLKRETNESSIVLLKKKMYQYNYIYKRIVIYIGEPEEEEERSPTESVATMSNRFTRAVTDHPTCWCLQFFNNYHHSKRYRLV